MRKENTYLYEMDTLEVYKGDRKGVYTEKQAESLFLKSLKRNGLYNEFIENFDTSDQKLMRELAKTYLINLSNIADLKINSLWLQTTSDLIQASNLVKFYDYSIVRHKAPKVELRYIGSDTIMLNRGEVIGKFGDYDIINHQDKMYLEYGDIKEFSLGKYVVMDNISLIKDGIFKLNLFPKHLKSIDNDLMFIKLDNTESYETLTKHISRYIDGVAIRDFSIDNTSTTLYISDSEKRFGIADKLEDHTSIKISYLETDGVLPDVVGVTINDVKIEDRFKDKFDYIRYGYIGYDGDTIDTLRNYAPLVSTTKGFANSFKDYKVLMEAIPEIYDCNLYKEDGKGEKEVFRVTALPIRFRVEQTEFSLDELTDAKIKELNLQMLNKFGEWYNLVKIDDNTISIETVAYKYRNNVDIISGMVLKRVDKGIKPDCCTIIVPYIREALQKGKDDLISFTPVEKESVDKQVNHFKSWNTTVILYPATKRVLKFTVNIDTSKKVDSMEDVKKKVLDIIDSYSYKVGAILPIPELMVRLSNIVLRDGDFEEYLAVVKASIDKEIVDMVYKTKKDEYFVIEPKIVLKKWV